MKLKTFVTLSAVLILVSGTAHASHVWDNSDAWANELLTYDQKSTALYSENDLFKTDIRNGTWGGGVGLNYFLTREIGISGDINMGDNGGSFVDQALGSLILRWPIGSSCFAPYVFGGGGRAFDPTWEWLGDAGVGFEFRMNPLAGFFIDSRYLWHVKEGSSDRIFFRAGLRVVF